VGTKAERIIDELRGRGERITPARRAVIDELASAEGHLTADDLVDRVHATVPSAHRATIYRTMDTLERLGVVEHTHLGHGRAIYHLAEDAHPHLVCERCGAVVQLASNALAGIEEEVRQRHGFVLLAHHFALVGRCQACAEQG
jgi:Fe2+ or Zn2+ uptake regulation protein